MSVGNITPRTATQTLAGMLLGSETYPSVLQQALCNNTGYLMYREQGLHQSNGGTAVVSTAGTNFSGLRSVYLSSGNYDFEIRMTASAITGGLGYAWLQLGTDHISSDNLIASVGTTIVEKFTGVAISAGWLLLAAYVTSNGVADSEIYDIDVYSRQYA